MSSQLPPWCSPASPLGLPTSPGPPQPCYPMVPAQNPALPRKPLPLPSSCPQDCDIGYTRMPSGLYLGTCERCSCHGHTEVCEPESGACQVSPALLSYLRGLQPSRAQSQPTLCPSRAASTIPRALSASSASQDTTGTPSGGHRKTASHARAMEPLLLASGSSPCLYLPCPEMSHCPLPDSLPPRPF